MRRMNALESNAVSVTQWTVMHGLHSASPLLATDYRGDVQTAPVMSHYFWSRHVLNKSFT